MCTPSSPSSPVARSPLKLRGLLPAGGNTFVGQRGGGLPLPLQQAEPPPSELIARAARGLEAGDLQTPEEDAACLEALQRLLQA